MHVLLLGHCNGKLKRMHESLGPMQLNIMLWNNYAISSMVHINVACALITLMLLNLTSLCKYI